MPATLTTTFTLISGISWSIVYIDIIQRGLRDKIYGMPFFALAFNICWELIYAFLIDQRIPLQRAVNVLWFVLDLIILYTYLRFGRKEFPTAYSRFFVAWIVVVLAIAFAILYAAATEWPDARGGTYSAFAQNLMMSVLFIAMLVSRGSVAGQSMYIAGFKWLGTLAPTILVWVVVGSKLVLALGIACFIFDGLYFVLLYRRFLQLGLKPFTRRASVPSAVVVK